MTIPDSDLIEPRFKKAIDRYVENGIPTGGFLKAVLENDLSGAITRADPKGLENLPHIVCYVYNEIPGSTWGTPNRVSIWLAHDGQEGKPS